MTEDDARSWTSNHFGAAVVDRLVHFIDLLTDEMERQNLIAPSTLSTIWSRHLVDSLQLARFATPAAVQWLDVGTGAGFPGLILAAAMDAQFTLVEPRKRRVEFLDRCSRSLGLTNVTILAAKVEAVQRPSHIITARAVASIEKLLQSTAGCSTAKTRWLLPRGAVDPDELRLLAKRHGVMFHVEQSLTASESSIVIVDGVTR